jgi:hypothetical protein
MYVVLDGGPAATCAGETVTVDRFDSVHFARGEQRAPVENRSGQGVLLVIAGPAGPIATKAGNPALPATPKRPPPKPSLLTRRGRPWCPPACAASGSVHREHEHRPARHRPGRRAVSDPRSAVNGVGLRVPAQERSGLLEV